MELIAYILYGLASKNILLLIVSIFLTIGGFFLVRSRISANRESQPSDDRRKSLPCLMMGVLVQIVLVGSLLVIVGILIYSILNIIRPHLIDGPLINAIGQKADAKVLKVEATSNLLNEQRVMRHYVIYKTADGKNIETYFETWDFNIYPSANTVTYPGQGQSFRVAYLPNFPTAFIILTKEDSDYSRGQQCAKILADLDEARIKSEFDPADKNYRKAFEEATKKAIAAKCVGSDSGLPSGGHREFPARTQ